VIGYLTFLLRHLYSLWCQVEIAWICYFSANFRYEILNFRFLYLFRRVEVYSVQVVLLTCFVIRLMLVFFCNLSVFFMSFHLTHYYFHYLHSLLYHSFHLVLFWYYFYVKNWLNDLDFFVDGFLPKNHSFLQNVPLFYTHRVVYLIVWFIHWVFCFSWPPSSILARPFLLVLSTEISIFFSSFLVPLWVLCFSWLDSPYRVKFRLIFTDH